MPGCGSFSRWSVADSGNLGAAMREFLDRGGEGQAAELGLALWQFWWVHGLFRPGIGWMEEVLAHGPDLTEAERAHASLVLGMLRFGQGDHERALPALRAAVELHAASATAAPRPSRRSRSGSSWRKPTRPRGRRCSRPP